MHAVHSVYIYLKDDRHVLLDGNNHRPSLDRLTCRIVVGDVEWQ
jgi:hypothetical protein